jgi:hypothetical protein
MFLSDVFFKFFDVKLSVVFLMYVGLVAVWMEHPTKPLYDLPKEKTSVSSGQK